MDWSVEQRIARAEEILARLEDWKFGPNPERARRDRQHAAWRVRSAIERRLVKTPDPYHWLWDIFGPMRAHHSLGEMRATNVPFGWVQVRLWDRCASRTLPCWIAWPYIAWLYRWSVLEPLVRIGLVKMRDGAYWNTARPWFWNAEREASFREIFNVGKQ